MVCNYYLLCNIKYTQRSSTSARRGINDNKKGFSGECAREKEINVKYCKDDRLGFVIQHLRVILLPPRRLITGYALNMHVNHNRGAIFVYYYNGQTRKIFKKEIFIIYRK